MYAGVDCEAAYRLDEVHRPGAEPVEVAGEERVGATQLARAALRAVDEVAGDIRYFKVTVVETDHVSVKRGRGPRFIPRHLHDRAHLAAKLVPGRIAVVCGVAPLRCELGGQTVPLASRDLFHPLPPGACVEPCDGTKDYMLIVLLTTLSCSGP